MRHEDFMLKALDLSRGGEGKVAPNPLVGSVIVEGDNMVAYGYHAYFGGLHAEDMALEDLGRFPQEGAIMYVTLEPCSTVGKTGACTDIIIASGIKNVVIGGVDPNPKHNGKGIEILRAKGINVIVGILEKQCRDINNEFNDLMNKRMKL